MYPPELRFTMNPCGLVMDHLVGYGYQQQTVGFADGRSVVLRWFPAHRYAKSFPSPIAFGSTSNDPSCEDYRGVGTTPAGKIWLQDEYLPYAGDGTFCGRLEWFSEGLPANPPAGFDPCPRCVIEMGGPDVAFFTAGADVGLDLFAFELDGANVVPVGPEVQLAVEGIGAGGPEVQLVAQGADVGGPDSALEVGGLVATGAYSTAFGSAWDSYRFE